MLASRHQVFRQALPRVLPFYVVKCNSRPWVLRVLATLGTGFDCASQYAARHGVRFLTFNSEEELIKVAQHHPGARLVLRLWTQDSESILPLSAKFGASLEVCEHMLESARDLWLAVVGTSFHVGSSCQTPHSFTQAITNCRRVFEMGCGVRHDMSLLDTGEGFPREEGSDSKFEEGIGVEVIAESGRFYAASVCLIAVNIIARKAVMEPDWQDLCPKLPLFSCTLYSPTCNAFDKLFLKEVQLPELDVGDWLVFPSMGACTSAMSSAFNGFPLPSICCAMGPELRCLGE
eukprot:bmy_14971T0